MTEAKNCTMKDIFSKRYRLSFDKIKINSKRVFYTLNNCYSITTLVKHFFGETRSKEKVGGGGKKANATWGTTAAGS